jgi:hypothetical protein
MTFLLDDGLRGYWENPAFVIGVIVLVIGAFLLLLIARSYRLPAEGASSDGALGLVTTHQASWFVAGAAGAALLIAGVVYNPAFAIGGGFIVLVASVRMLRD